MKVSIKLLLVVIAFLCSILAKAQDQQYFSGSYRNSNFSDIIIDLESRYDLSFFYLQNLDSVKINLTFSDISLDKLVKKFTKATNVTFITRHNNSIISIGAFKVDTELSNIFFNNQPPSTKTAQSVFDNTGEFINEDKDHYFFKFPFKHSQVVDTAV